MASASRGSGLSRETLTAMVLAVEDEKRLQEIEKLGLSISESIWVTETDLQRVLDWSTDKSRSARRPRFPGRMPKGTAFRINLGDRIPKGPSFRPATTEEIASGIVTIEDAAEHVEALRPVTTAEALAESVRHEVERARLEVEAAKRRAAHLDEALAVAQGRAEQARSDFEKLFANRSEEWRARVADLARQLETSPAPAQEKELPRTVDEIARRSRASDTAPAYKMGRSGPEPLLVTRTRT